MRLNGGQVNMHQQQLPFFNQSISEEQKKFSPCMQRMSVLNVVMLSGQIKRYPPCDSQNICIGDDLKAKQLQEEKQTHVILASYVVAIEYSNSALCGYRE